MENKESIKNKSIQAKCKYDNDPVFRQGVAIVSKNKRYGAIMVGGKEIVSPIYDALSDFVDGFAIAKLRNEERTINLSGQIQVKKGEEYVFLPQEYDWGYDFVDNICIVEKINRQVNWQTVGRLGIISIKNYSSSTEISLEELLPCEYSSIRPLKDGFFLIERDYRYGLINSNGEIIAETKYNTITVTNDKYFHLERIENNYNQPTRHYFCIIDEKGTPLTPTDCTEITNTTIDNVDYWIVARDKWKGVYCNNKQIVPIYFKEIKALPTSFECTYRDSSKVVYNIQGQVVINYLGRQIVFPSDYIIVLDSPIGLFRAKKDEGWGIVNQKKEELIPHKYVFIEPFVNGFAKIVKRIPDEKGIYRDGKGNHYSERYGLIDTMGNVVLPPEYDELNYCNGCWVIRKNYKYGLLSASLSEIIPPTYSRMEPLANNFFILKIDGKEGLIDNAGKEIFQLGSYDEIEEFGDAFFKLIKYYNGDVFTICIANHSGKTIVEDHYKKASYIDNGLMILSDLEGSKTLFNLQGERIFQEDYAKIEKRDDGLLTLKSYRGWGIGGADGEIIIETEYLEKINFEGETATIQVDEYSIRQRINRDGRIIVHEGDNEVMLPEGVYWGTDFTNGISIVRGKRESYYKRNVIGVADENGNIIIPTKYTKICLLSNNTIRVIDEDCCGVEGLRCYGLYDLKGKGIFPPIFTLIKYVAEDRVRVCWNLNIAKEWNNAGYIPGPCEENDKESVRFLVGYRATLCNLSGKIVCDKDFLYVGTFVGQYASAYKEVCIENGKRRFKKGGVIDVTGKTIIKPIYDGIKLYENIEYIKVRKGDKVGIIDYTNKTVLEPVYDIIKLYDNSQFARIKKDDKVGIVDLQTKRERLFEGLTIQRIGKVDALGRCAYSEETEDGTWGVIGINGMIIPSGKYQHVCLLRNGLIKVSNETDNWSSMQLFGLLNDNGKEILPLKYTEITSFVNNRAGICLGGKYNEYDELQDGKWGVVDITGKIIVDCKYDGIRLSDGVIVVSNNSGELTLYGLLDENGNEIFPIKCSSISSFVNERTVIRVGATKLDEKDAFEFKKDIIGGKWSVIDKKGNYLIEEIKSSRIIDDIKLLDNGLMIVWHYYNDYIYYGLLDECGNELLPAEYSYIDDFKDGLAALCIGGEPDYFTGEPTKEKWGIIDKTGRFIKECKYTRDEVCRETGENNDNKEYQAPSIILSDTIESDEQYYDYSYDRDSYDDDYCASNEYGKYGGYNGYDDNTIDEAFDGDPGLTWNID